VLEISATPYLYTLRFYDWLRRDLDGELRPVHLRHAFSNLDPQRRGDAVRELMPEPVTVRQGEGWAELALSSLPRLFFAVHRLDFEDEIADDTAGRFHALNLVGGEQVEIETGAGDVHPLAYAETIVIPAAVGAYRIRRVRGGSCKVVKALVR
jgi:mannose-6-phosphate isomerase class I